MNACPRSPLRTYVMATLAPGMLMGLCMASGPAIAAEVFGVTTGQGSFIPAYEFRGVRDNGDCGLSQDLFLEDYYYAAGGCTGFIAHLEIAEGGIIDAYYLFYIDNNAGAGISTSIGKSFAPVADVASGTGVVTLPGSSLATSGASPNRRVGLAFPTQSVYDSYLASTNMHQFYSVRISLPQLQGLLFRGVWVFWRRQIAPPPASASFGDVPTSHPFFNEVEQLAKSGITQGCGGDNFCPDAAVTRGQMAAFLSRALGLHWDLSTNAQ